MAIGGRGGGVLGPGVHGGRRRGCAAPEQSRSQIGGAERKSSCRALVQDGAVQAHAPVGLARLVRGRFGPGHMQRQMHTLWMGAWTRRAMNRARVRLVSAEVVRGELVSSLSRSAAGTTFAMMRRTRVAFQPCRCGVDHATRGRGHRLRNPRPVLDQLQVMLISRSKLMYPARWKAFAIGMLPRSVDARMRGTRCSARIRVPSARMSSM